MPAARRFLGKPAAASFVLAGALAALAPSARGSTSVTAQAISVPKGQGTLEGHGESFSTQLSTGVWSYTVPIATPPARGGAGPSLALTYGSAAGAGAAGLGWSLAAPSISRQTDRGIPKYKDAPNGAYTAEQDRFVFDGGAELVPLGVVVAQTCAAAPGEAFPAWANGWQYFRPRVESGFARFFWSSDRKTWRVQHKSGALLELGVPLDGTGYVGAVESDPDAPSRIFRWSLARKLDAQGSVDAPVNIVAYRYATREGTTYLTDVYDTPPTSAPWRASLDTYANHVRIAYQDRTDPTFSFRHGWRTGLTQRIARIDVTSKGDTSAAPRELVRRYHLAYVPQRHVSLLASVTVEGRCDAAGARKTPEDATGGLPATSCARLPPMTFEYTDGGRAGAAPLPFRDFGTFDGSLRTLAGAPPIGLDAPDTDLFDLNADGLPDVLVTSPSAEIPDHGVFFNGWQGARDTIGRLVPFLMQDGSPLTTTDVGLSRPNVLALDVDGDGTTDLFSVASDATSHVLAPKKIGVGWRWVARPFVTPTIAGSYLDVGGERSATRVLDVDGDGLVDIVVSQGTKLLTYFALGRFPSGDGHFGRARAVSASTASLSDEPHVACAPGDDLQVTLSDPDVTVADMNGDGLVDLVRMNPGSLQYWPGRGDGTWGVVPPLSCAPRRSAGVTAEITMASAPSFDRNRATVTQLSDVNGDGLDDLVTVFNGTIRAYLNVDGKAFTPTGIAIDRPEMMYASAGTVRLVDIDGTGTPDVVWGTDQGYRYVDLLGGARPSLLRKVANGLGRTTEIEYATSTALMLDAEKAGSTQAWTSKMPTVAHVVRRVTESDNLAVAGRPANTYFTEYSYKNPVYEARQREFRGFREATSRSGGDANSPPSTTRSRFLTGDCVDETPSDTVADCEPQGRYRDNGREALKGLPVVSDRFDDKGVYLSTTHHTYTLRQLYAGLDGRNVRHAFESATDTWKYDTAPFVPSSSSSSQADAVLVGVTGAAPTSTVTLASSAGRARTRTTSEMDRYGNTTRETNLGCVEGCAAPDEEITTETDAKLAPGDTSGWLWRPAATRTGGSRTEGKRKVMTLEHDVHGNLRVTRAVLSGTLPLDRSHETPGAPFAARPPPSASVDGTIVVSAQDYDDFGNPTFVRVPNNGCRKVIYDGYATLPSAELTYVGGLGEDAGEPGSRASQAFAASPAGAACGARVLPSTATYDRGLGQITQVTGIHGETTRVEYDAFGRLAQFFAPHPTTVGKVSEQPSVRVTYDVDPTGRRPYSLLHTETHDGVASTDASYRSSWAYVDGLGRTVVTLEQADPSPEAGDRGAWVVSGLTDFDHKGAPERVFLPWFSNAAPTAYPLGDAPGSALFTEHRYDAFGREWQTIDTGREVSLESSFHALSTDVRDGADLRSTTHGGTFGSTRVDGHGRTVVTTVRIKSGAGLELHETRATYLPTGEPTSLARVRVGASDPPVVRWMRYDSLGRLVLNAEPNTSARFAPPGAAAPDVTSDQRMRAWRYAYDDAGKVVGTSDARGCGVNTFYDAAGRAFASDDSPCRGSQAAYTEPDLVTGDGTESFSRYDLPEPDAAPGCPQDASTLLGRVSSMSDRGGRVVTTYDARGRPTCIAKRIAKPGASARMLARRYADDWFASAGKLDAANRPIEASTGAIVPELLGKGGKSLLTTTYTKRGLVQVAGSSYGDLVTAVTREPDGRVGTIRYGDGADTVTAFGYDEKLRLKTVQTYRGPPPSATPRAPGTPSSFGPMLLEDGFFEYDEVGNPIKIDDRRIADEWLPGAKPVKRTMTYDDLNRLASIRYEHLRGEDTWVSPFDAENDDTVDDATRARPSPHVAFDKRVKSQTFAYDYLGNTIATGDDARGFYDRSLGAITNGTSTGKSYQLVSATNDTGAQSSREGTVRAKYDDAGYLVDMTLVRDGPCLPAGAVCSQRFLYDWDEEGNLAHARRWDLADPGIPGAAEPLAAPAAELRYVYGVEGMRTVKSAVDARGRERHTVYALPSLELRRAVFDGARYERTRETEVPYLFAHGVRVARVAYLAQDVAGAASGRRRVFLEMPDHLGSTSSVVDLDSGELVERATYQAYGAADSDARSERWGSFREDYRFTGKEEDIEVGLQYFGKRYYAPALARWISADPLAVHEPGGADLNLYAYVGGRVLTAVDPDGLDDVPAGATDYQSHGTANGNELGSYVPPPSMNPGQVDFEIVELSPNQHVTKHAPAMQAVTPREPATESIAILPFFLRDYHGGEAWRQSVRPFQQPGPGAPHGLAAIRQLNGGSPLAVAQFSREVAPGTSVESLTSHVVQATSGAVSALAAGANLLRPPPLLVRPPGFIREPITPQSAYNVANGPRLSKQLVLDEASSMFTAAGELHPEALASSSRIIEGADLSTGVAAHLTKDGSKIADWGKYTTQTANSPSGPYQVHFYYNPATGQVNYGRDFKAVFNNNGVWKK